MPERFFFQVRVMSKVMDLELGALGAAELECEQVQFAEFSAWCAACALCAGCGAAIAAWAGVSAFASF